MSDKQDWPQEPWEYDYNIADNWGTLKDANRETTQREVKDGRQTESD